jgi:DNA-binding winged helix-turn-helix (wHTH) protein/TolB-like protein/Flp pilus assembly protein TadD
MSQRTVNSADFEPTEESYVFGPFRLNPPERTLIREGEPISLTPKAFEILTVLVRNSGHLVSKDRLMQEVWPDAFVEEANITQHVSMLRKALGEATDEHRYIETVPREGYRFTASVRHESIGVAAPPQRASIVPIGLALPDENKDAVQKWRPGARTLAALILLGIAVALSYFWIAGWPHQPATAAATRTIAVLPFKSIGSEGDNEYFELGMADALITRLSNLRGIIVRPTSSVSKYTRLQQDAITSGRELGVEAVLDGSVQKIGDRIRITVRLIRSSDGSSLWAETFDEKWTDVFTVQSSIAQKTAGALALQLTGEERRLLSKRYTDNAEAYQFYLKGRYSSNKWTAEGFRKAIEYFNQAITLDPSYALAYAGLADCYFGLSAFYTPPKDVLPKLKEMATKAVMLDQSLAEAHSSLSVAMEYYDLDWSGAEKEMRRAIELNPNSAQAHLNYGDLLSNLGRFDEAKSEFEKAQELDVTSALTMSMAYNFLRIGDYERAIKESEKILELEPDYKWALGAAGFAYLYKGEPEKALAVFQKQMESADLRKLALEGVGRSYAAMGERVQALKIIDDLRETAKHEYVPSFLIATIYLQLGDKNKAIEYLEKTYEERNTFLLVLLKTDSQFDVLRSDPRFMKLMRQLNFAT